ncbi:chloride channel protein [Streptococcus halotolerans]|uniref:chloride channel protein n=1 Tax=Streptococcus halotolerans TaxID=1814128 RepID=UPI000787908C|nr:chloride channel protein [Streptococcus halotolerans]
MLGIVLHAILEATIEVASLFGNESMTIGHAFLLILSGFAAGFSWYFLQRPPNVLYRIHDLVFNKKLDQLNYQRQIWHVLIQIITVGLGSPIGKEAAPRELGALMAQPLGKKLGLTQTDRTFLAAAGVGAGLSAIYQVPLGSVFFVFETLRLDYSINRFIEVSLVTYLSAWTASLVISTDPLFPVNHVEASWQSLLGIIIITFVLIPFAKLFKRLIIRVESQKIKSVSMMILLPLLFSVLALVAFYYPQIMGNGSEMVITFLKLPDRYTVVALLLLKTIFVLTTLKAGAFGGTLTPSFALGMGLAYLLVAPFSFESGFLLTLMTTGSLVFLTTCLEAPLAAFFLVVGFTGISYQVYPHLFVSLLLVQFWSHQCDKGLKRKR